ncbi:DUF4625 domain-containing protein [Flammeovirga agarivorans]|uniref:DUF4625 domain-containing protein n=1 Tax=Flammeovirga agarivorans TaxID=2726742 RepID=A0A7X8SHV3_9BACT|nr:DUF4625 domain-containing protein [Flammeovirga agarivorans]NLR90471.1 DUF4625 domain-containing protein [Flammeovirga agarivorans]
MKFVNLLAILSILAFASCNNDDNESNPLPTIEDYTIEHAEEHSHERASSEDEGETVVAPGEELAVTAKLSGNKLSYVQIDIHWGEGHDHDRVKSTDDGEWSQKITYWFGKTEEDAGPNDIILSSVNPDSWPFDAHIDVPEEVDGVETKAGDYHFVMYLVDLEGQQTTQALTVEVHHEDHDH